MSDARARPYVESTIIMTTVRVVTPFVFTFGLFVMFHGADSVGGGFQGGVITAASVIVLAFAFGVEETRVWLGESSLLRLASLGVVAFGAIGLGAIVLRGQFLEYAVYGFEHAEKYGIEAVELAIGAIVTGAILIIFFGLYGGPERPVDGSTEEGEA